MIGRLGYRRAIRRAVACAAAAARRPADVGAVARIADAWPGLDRAARESIAIEAATRLAFRSVAAPALLRLPAVAFCGELRFDASWSDLAASTPPRLIVLPDLGAPAVARRAARLHLPVYEDGDATSFVEAPAAEAGEFVTPDLPGAGAVHLLIAALGPETTARISVETLDRANEVASALANLRRREARHVDWSAPSGR